MCGPSALPSASKLSAMELASSGCRTSMPESMTATVTLAPCASVCACGRGGFGQRILRGISLGWHRRFLVLEQVAEVRLDRTHAAIGREFAPHRRGGPAVGDAEQSERCPDQRKILGSHASQAMATRKLVGLGRRQPAIDLGDKFAGK